MTSEQSLDWLKNKFGTISGDIFLNVQFSKTFYGFKNVSAENSTLDMIKKTWNFMNFIIKNLRILHLKLCKKEVEMDMITAGARAYSGAPSAGYKAEVK